MKVDIETQVRTFIEDNFLFREDRASLSDTESLLDAGLIDSTGILELVAFLETAVRHPHGGRRHRSGQPRLDQGHRRPTSTAQARRRAAAGRERLRHARRAVPAGQRRTGSRTRPRWSPAAARLTYARARRGVGPARRRRSRSARPRARRPRRRLHGQLLGGGGRASSPCSRPAACSARSIRRPRPTSSPTSSTIAAHRRS